MLDEKGRPLGTRVFKPEEVYRAVRGVPPDLIVYFGNLRWRSVGSLGLGTVHTFENDTGPDDANHSEYGIFILREPGLKNRRGGGLYSGGGGGLSVMNIPPPILDRFVFPPLAGMQGKVIE